MYVHVHKNSTCIGIHINDMKWTHVGHMTDHVISLIVFPSDYPEGHH